MKKLITPLIWSAVGVGLVIWSITSSGPLSAFLHVPSIIITLFGSMSALFVSIPFDEVKKIPKVFKELLIEEDISRVDLVQAFSELSKKARINGILSIEKEVESIENPMLARGIQMIVDGKDGDAIKSQIELEIDLIEENYQVAPLVLNKWGEYAPAFGMIGTLIGLIVMLGELNDPSTIGTGMAVALLTTFYGSFLANLVFLPMAGNIEQLIEAKMISYEIILEGVTSMQEGQNPRDIEEKLKAYLTTQELAELETSEAVSLGRLGSQEG